MAERYTRLFALTEDLYQSGAPVLIAAGALLKDNQTNRALAQIKLQSLSDKPIKAAKISITPLDVVGNKLGETIEHQYLDLNIQRDEEFGTKSPIYLPDATTRAFRAAVTSVVFVDNTVWSASNAAWEPLPAPVTLAEAYPDAELRKQFKLEFGAQSQYTYAEFADLCRCPCGTLNRQEEAKCHTCGCDLLALRGMDIAELEKRKDERLEQERIEGEERVERERLAKEKAAIEATERAKKAKKIALIAAPIVCVVIAFLIVLNSVIIPNVKYNNAVTLMEAGQYEEAIEAFEAMDGYKDSAEKLDECAVAILDAAYDTAVTWMELGDYETAIEGFEILGEYRDSAEKIVECELASQYDAAVELVELGEYREAYDVFEALGGYKDSGSMLKKCRNAMSESPKVGDYLFFGSYEQDNISSNGKEEIQWIVLDVHANQTLLISKLALDCQPYNKERDFVKWKSCTLRTWLNKTFLNAAFSMQEQTQILTTTIAENNWETQDKIFVLDTSEVEKYFQPDELGCQRTDYATSRGAAEYVDKGCSWWLRSTMTFEAFNITLPHAASVQFYFSGSVIDSSNVDSTGICIRPAIWVDLNN